MSRTHYPPTTAPYYGPRGGAPDPLGGEQSFFAGFGPDYTPPPGPIFDNNPLTDDALKRKGKSKKKKSKKGKSKKGKSKRLVKSFNVHDYLKPLKKPTRKGRSRKEI